MFMNTSLSMECEALEEDSNSLATYDYLLASHQDTPRMSAVTLVSQIDTPPPSIHFLGNVSPLHPRGLFAPLSIEFYRI